MNSTDTSKLVDLSVKMAHCRSQSRELQIKVTKKDTEIYDLEREIQRFRDENQKLRLENERLHDDGNIVALRSQVRKLLHETKTQAEMIKLYQETQIKAEVETYELKERLQWTQQKLAKAEDELKNSLFRTECLKRECDRYIEIIVDFRAKVKKQMQSKGVQTKKAFATSHSKRASISDRVDFEEVFTRYPGMELTLSLDTVRKLEKVESSLKDSFMAGRVKESLSNSKQRGKEPSTKASSFVRETHARKESQPFNLEQALKQDQGTHTEGIRGYLFDDDASNSGLQAGDKTEVDQSSPEEETIPPSATKSSNSVAGELQARIATKLSEVRTNLKQVGVLQLYRENRSFEGRPPLQSPRSARGVDNSSGASKQDCLSKKLLSLAVADISNLLEALGSEEQQLTFLSTVKKKRNSLIQSSQKFQRKPSISEGLLPPQPQSSTKKRLLRKSSVRESVSPRPNRVALTVKKKAPLLNRDLHLSPSLRATLLNKSPTSKKKPPISVSKRGSKPSFAPSLHHACLKIQQAEGKPHLSRQRHVASIDTRRFTSDSFAETAMNSAVPQDLLQDL